MFFPTTKHSINRCMCIDLFCCCSQNVLDQILHFTSLPLTVILAYTGNNLKLLRNLLLEGIPVYCFIIVQIASTEIMQLHRHETDAFTGKK